MASQLVCGIKARGSCCGVTELLPVLVYQRDPVAFAVGFADTIAHCPVVRLLSLWTLAVCHSLFLAVSLFLLLWALRLL